MIKAASRILNPSPSPHHSLRAYFFENRYNTSKGEDQEEIKIKKITKLMEID